MKLRILSAFLAVAAFCFGGDPVAARLARMARKAGDTGLIVRAFMLYSEAAARDPLNSSYRANRDALAPAARLFTQNQIQAADISDDVLLAQKAPPGTEPPIERVSQNSWEASETLNPVPQIRTDESRRDINLQSADVKTLFEQITSAWGIHAEVDSEVQLTGRTVRLQLDQADFRTALEALTDATNTFAFPISEKTLFFAPDTEIKRAQLEPEIVLTFHLPDALSEKDVIDVANSVRSVMTVRAFGWDSANRIVMIRDKITRARAARSLVEALLLPPGQLNFEVEFITLDTDRKTSYGATLQTAFQLIDFGRIGGFKSILPAAFNSSKFVTFGGGATLFGIGLADATAFANYSNSISRTIYNATVTVADRQTVTLQIGDKYPIASSIYTGFNQGSSSIYNPAPQITMEDLGLNLKLTPHINGDGEVDLAVEAAYKALGTETLNTIPTIAERSFKGNVNIREGQWAILAGIDSKTQSFSRSGWAGISDIWGLKQLLSSNTREISTSNTLLVIKPVITRLPITDAISPQYLIGPRKGVKVLL